MLDIQIPGDVSDRTVAEIIGNILEHVEHENKFWQEEGIIAEHESVTALIVDDEDNGGDTRGCIWISRTFEDA